MFIFLKSMLNNPSGSTPFNTTACSPEELKIGMVVCLQATPTVVPTTKGGNKVILKLRSVLQINDELFKVR